MAQPVRVELDGALDGRHILVDVDEITFGDMEDIQSGQIKLVLDTFSRLIVGGDLPHGTARDGLRKLKRAEVDAIAKGVYTAFAVPKS